jgi:hypothetical protein
MWYTWHMFDPAFPEFETISAENNKKIKIFPIRYIKDLNLHPESEKIISENNKKFLNSLFVTCEI